jgi:hypothetical protein
MLGGVPHGQQRIVLLARDVLQRVSRTHLFDGSGRHLGRHDW